MLRGWANLFFTDGQEKALVSAQRLHGIDSREARDLLSVLPMLGHIGVHMKWWHVFYNRSRWKIGSGKAYDSQHITSVQVWCHELCESIHLPESCWYRFKTHAKKLISGQPIWHRIILQNTLIGRPLLWSLRNGIPALALSLLMLLSCPSITRLGFWYAHSQTSNLIINICCPISPRTSPPHLPQIHIVTYCSSLELLLVLITHGLYPPVGLCHQSLHHPRPCWLSLHD